MLLLGVLLTISCVPSQGVNYPKIGVKIGDYADYSYTFWFNGSYHTPFDWYRILVANISLSSIPGYTELSIEFDGHFANGTWYSPWTGHLDLSNNSVLTGGVVDDIMWIVPADLVNGQLVSIPYVINETTSMLVAGAVRTVNHLRIAADNFGAGDYHPDIYWDKATGVLVKANILRHNTWTNLTMLSTNMWSNGDWTTLLLISGGVALVIGVACLVAFVIRKRRS